MNVPNPSYHAPVLLRECLDAMQLGTGGVFVDATFGGGGHSAQILAEMPAGAHLYSFDQDNDAEQNAKHAPFTGHSGFHFIKANFQYLKRMLRSEGVRPGSVKAVLADLGVSSYQLDTPERGFSYRFDAPLDMRMNTADGPTAATVLNTYSAEQLQNIFSTLGEVRNARTLALACVAERTMHKFKSTGDLVLLCDKHVFGERWRYLSQVFQALRMEVNEEVAVLGELMAQCHEMLAPNGLLIVMTYHSIEDRIVKNYLKTGNAEGNVDKDFYGNITRPWSLVNKKPIEPSAAEIKQNPRARSAKLRVAAKNDKP